MISMCVDYLLGTDKKKSVNYEIVYVLKKGKTFWNNVLHTCIASVKQVRKIKKQKI